MQKRARILPAPRRAPDGFSAESRLLRALAHPQRLAIVAALRNDEVCTCRLAARLARPLPYVSQQLAVLRRAGIVRRRRERTFLHYRLRDYGVLGVLDLAVRLVEGRSTR